MTLSIEHCYSIQGNQLFSLLQQSKSRLRIFNVTGCNQLTVEDLNRLVLEGFLDETIDLRLASTAVKDETLQLLAKNLHRIKTLNLSNTEITGIGIKALALKPHGRLENLALRWCNLVSVDAVDFAKACGIRVNYSFPEHKGKAKKVRC